MIILIWSLLGGILANFINKIYGNERLNENAKKHPILDFLLALILGPVCWINYIFWKLNK